MAYTDNSSALGWLHKASFDPVKKEAHNHVAREMAKFLMDNELSLYSQHIKGKHNVIADSLSRDMHICDNKLTFLLNNLFPFQTRKNLNLEPLSNKIECMLYSLKDMLTNRQAYHATRTPSSLGHLIDGDDSWKDVAWKMNSWTTSRRNNECVSCPHLQQVLETMNTEKQGEHNYAKALLVPPLATFVRPSGRTYGGTRL